MINFMEAIPACVNSENVVAGSAGLLVKSRAFKEAIKPYHIGAGPIAEASTSAERYRVFLTVNDMPKLTGIYYVSGWLDEGYVHLNRDDDQVRIIPDRRAAVLATRTKRTLS